MNTTHSLITLAMTSFNLGATKRQNTSQRSQGEVGVLTLGLDSCENHIHLLLGEALADNVQLFDTLHPLHAIDFLRSRCKFRPEGVLTLNERGKLGTRRRNVNCLGCTGSLGHEQCLVETYLMPEQGRVHAHLDWGICVVARNRTFDRGEKECSERKLHKKMHRSDGEHTSATWPCVLVLWAGTERKA